MRLFCRSLQFSLFTVPFSTLLYLGNSSHLDFPKFSALLFNCSGLHQDSLSQCFVLETSQGGETTIGFPSLAFCLSGTIGPHCLVSTVLKTGVSRNLLIFVCFSQERKYSLYYYTLVRRRNQFIPFYCQGYSIAQIHQFVYSFTYWRARLFPVWGNLNKASINICRNTDFQLSWVNTQEWYYSVAY